MSAPLLHSRVRDSIEISDSPRQVLDKIKALAEEQFRLEVDDSDPDNILFEMTRQSEDIIISGLIRRWQGTESRLDFIGEVNIPPHDSRKQQAIVALLVILTSIFLFDFIILDSIRTSRFIRLPDIFILFVAWSFPTIIVALIAYPLIVHNTANRKRWHLQQELAKIIERIRRIETYAV